MKFSEYSTSAMAFASIQATPKDDLIHAALGLTSDTGELIECIANHLYDGQVLDQTNLVEEAGDVIWFANLGAVVIGRDLGQLYVISLQSKNPANMSIQALLDWLVIEAARVADIIKGHAIYGKPLDEAALASTIGNVTVTLAVASIVGSWGVPIRDVLDANIAKLTKRYGAKFDAYRALHRDKDAERAAIEGVTQ